MNKKYLRQLAFYTMTKKKKRTILTIGATAISTAILTVSLLLLVFVVNILHRDYQNVDQYHYQLNETDEIDFSSRYHLFKEYRTETILQQEPLYVFDGDSKCYPFSSLKGHLPMNNREILVPESRANIGDLIEEYEVVGIYESKTTHHIYSTNLEGKLERYYILDDSIYLLSSQNDFLSYYHLDKSQLTLNLSLIQKDAISKNLENGPIISFILVMGVGLCMVMSLICLNNIMIISDPSRKKELGLLKSVGCGSQGISYLIVYELVVLGIIGAFIGIILGSLIGKAILQSVASHLYLSLTFYKIENMLIILLSGILGFCVLLYSGYHSYKHYVFSSPISDLKETNFEYDLPNLKTNPIKHSFVWDMFLKYNHRMKKQTKNITLSFSLLIISAILFSSIFLVCLVYNNTYTNADYDVVIKGNGFTNDKLVEALETTKPIVPLSSHQVERETYVNMIHDASNFNLKRLKEYLTTTKEVYYEDNHQLIRATVRFQTLYMRTKQIQELESHLLWGRVKDLGAREVVVVLDQEDPYGYELCENLTNDPYMVFTYSDLTKIDPTFHQEWQEYSEAYYSHNQEGNPDEFEIVGIVVLPNRASNHFSFPFETFPRVVIMDVNAVKPIPHRVYDTISYRLENKNDVVQLTLQIENILKQYDTNQAYEVRNFAIETVSNQSVVFILEVIIYPVFALLFLIAIINIYYVLSGNLYLKQKDISIFKSVGMKHKQLKHIFILEYLESYLQASWITCLLFIPIAFIQSQLTVLESFDFASNLLGSLIIALFIIAPLILSVIITIHLHQFKAITPLSIQLEGN